MQPVLSNKQDPIPVVAWSKKHIFFFDCSNTGIVGSNPAGSMDDVRVCIQKFPDWPPGARIANGTALCHWLKLYRYLLSQSSEFCRPNPLRCISTSVYCCKRVFRYRLSPETFEYTLVRPRFSMLCSHV